MTPAAAAEAVADGRPGGGPGPLRRAAAGVAAFAAGFTVLVATGGGLGAVALGILLAPVLGAVYAIVVDRVHRLHRVLGEAAVIDDVRLETPGRTVGMAILKTWLLVGGWVGGAVLLGAERSTLAGIGTIVIGGGLSRIAVAIVLRRWEQLDEERVVLVDGELKRLAPPSR